MRDRRRLLAVAGICIAAATLGAASAATAAPSTAFVRGLAAPAGPNYATQPGQSVRQLNASFVQSQLGLPTTGELARLLRSAPLPDAPSSTSPQGTVVRSLTYGCVNGHQTADPLSPPCVSSFRGDNGGATYPGVRARDVTVMVTIGVGEDFNLTRVRRWGGYYDMDRSPSADELAHLPELSRLRLYQTYFNGHYQTYGRRVHFVVYSYNQSRTETATSCQNIALENYALVHPFAVLIENALPPCYASTLAGLGVPSFDSGTQLDRAEYRRHPAMRWGFWPDAQVAEQLFTSYICQKVVRRPVVLSGNPLENGKTRKIGVIEEAGPGESFAFAKAVTADIRRCGADVVATVEITQKTKCSTSLVFGPDEVVNWYKDFRAKGVTTVVWPGCDDERLAGAAAVGRWYPEWVLWGAGDLDQDYAAAYPSLFGNPALDEWTRHAVVVTASSFQPYITDHRICFEAMRDVDPSVDTTDPTWYACGWYDGLRQFFSAIQLAGPRLTPAAMGRGARTFSTSRSTPQVPRCQYPPDSYACVIDAQVEWWDASGTSQPAGGIGPTGKQIGGCWRAMQAGRRYEAWHWPDGNIDAQLHDGDPCSYLGSYPVP